MTTASSDPWVRIGAFLATRREELGYKRRAPWSRHVEQPGFRQRVITDLELGSRDNYADETLKVAEDAYRLVRGSIRRAVAHGGLPARLDDQHPPQDNHQDDHQEETGEEPARAEHVLDTPVGRVLYEILDHLNRDTSGMPAEKRDELEEALAERFRSDFTVFFDAKLREMERRRDS